MISFARLPPSEGRVADSCPSTLCKIGKNKRPTVPYKNFATPYPKIWKLCRKLRFCIVLFKTFIYDNCDRKTFLSLCSANKIFILTLVLCLLFLYLTANFCSKMIVFNVCEVYAYRHHGSRASSSYFIFNDYVTILGH